MSVLQAQKSLAARVTYVMLVPVLFFAILYYGKPVLLPVFFAVLLAMLMAPVCRFFDRLHWHRAFSCIGCILILLLFLLLMLFVLGKQLYGFLEDMDKIREKFDNYSRQASAWIGDVLHIQPDQQDKLIESQRESIKPFFSKQAGYIASGFFRTLATAAIVLVFTFLLLFHKEKYEQFFLRFFPGSKQGNIEKVLNRITNVSQQYLTGRALSMLFLFILYAAALLLIGIKQALLLAAIASLLTVIPYVGPIAGGLFPFMTAIVTEDSLQPAIWVLVALIFIQAIDNYFVEPNLIGGEVRLTALSTILAIFIGGTLWGIAGMVLFVPLLAIAKIIFEKVNQLEPFAYVISDEGKSPSKWLMSLWKKSRKK